MAVAEESHPINDMYVASAVPCHAQRKRGIRSSVGSAKVEDWSTTMLQRTCPILSRAGPSRDCESHSECLVIYPQPLATGQCCDGVAAHVPDFSDALDHLAIAISYYLPSTSSHSTVLIGEWCIVHGRVLVY